MLPRIVALIALVAALARWVGAAEIALPPRPADAEGGAAFARRVAPLDRDAREAAVLAEIRRGNVPVFWRRFVDVKSEGAVLYVAPDYLCIGSDDDYWFAPLTPTAAQQAADALGCVLPTRKVVDLIYRAAPLKLEPRPIPPTAAMTTVPVFSEHNATLRTQRAAALSTYPLGTLVAGHKKDVVISPRLATAPDKVAIYGWHRLDGTAIQPLYLGHASTWADYSHGVRLVRRELTVDGVASTVAAVLADPQRAALLSDEGPIANPRYADEKIEEATFDGGVRAVINSPLRVDPAKPVRLVVFAAPAGNTIEQTLGHRLQPGEDWHFDIQHIAAQTRWLRANSTDANLVVAVIQCAQKSFVLWKRADPDHQRRSVEIVTALWQRFPGAKLVLTGHSAGGAFTFSYLDGIEKIPDEVERIAFLDSDYAYDTEKGHGTKLAAWLGAAAAHRLCVIAYQDYLALLDGKTFVSEAGGTWGRSQAMLADLGATFAFAREDANGLQRHTAAEGRVVFLLKENPEKAVLHTRQVEWNGFIEGLLSGTALEGRGYEYLGPRAYGDYLRDK